MWHSSTQPGVFSPGSLGPYEEPASNSLSYRPLGAPGFIRGVLREQIETPKAPLSQVGGSRRSRGKRWETRFPPLLDGARTAPSTGPTAGSPQHCPSKPARCRAQRNRRAAVLDDRSHLSETAPSSSSDQDGVRWHRLHARRDGAWLGRAGVEFSNSLASKLSFW